MMCASNEELLKDGECPSPNCVEERGHVGSHSDAMMAHDIGNLTEEEDNRIANADAYGLANYGDMMYFARALSAARGLAYRQAGTIEAVRAWQEDWDGAGGADWAALSAILKGG